MFLNETIHNDDQPLVISAWAPFFVAEKKKRKQIELHADDDKSKRHEYHAHHTSPYQLYCISPAEHMSITHWVMCTGQWLLGNEHDITLFIDSCIQSDYTLLPYRVSQEARLESQLIFSFHSVSV